MRYYQITYNLYEAHHSPEKKVFMLQNEKACDESEIKKLLTQHHNGTFITIIDRKEVTEEEYNKH